MRPKPFGVLAYLVENRDRVVSREELFSALWPGEVVGDSTLSSCIKDVRRALGDRGRRQRFIRRAESTSR